MRDAGCTVVTMEVSSHALDLYRTWGSHFAVTAFTNLTQDHLDYHHTFDDYFEAKAKLFSGDYPARRVISIDGSWGRELLRRCSAAGDDIITTGFDVSAQIHPVDVTYEATRTLVTLEVRGKKIAIEYPLVGRFNVENVMTAFGCALSLGVPVDVIVEALATMPPVPGRLEQVRPACEAPVVIYVDYAHTPDALTKAISSVKELSGGRTIVVFGCGGDRDASKRSIMGAAALDADFAVVTSDNPRSEDPNAIIEDIVAGMEDTSRFIVEPDRRAAIAAAIQQAQPGDAILLAGKGHEDYQLVGSEVISFDDRVVAAEELERAFAKPSA
jgi:UDP-N-acetylmuramoyl-L-alanyl-D-glutamate--2,6-diaminopimelate ligase